MTFDDPESLGVIPSSENGFVQLDPDWRLRAYDDKNWVLEKRYEARAGKGRTAPPLLDENGNQVYRWAIHGYYSDLDKGGRQALRSMLIEKAVSTEGQLDANSICDFLVILEQRISDSIARVLTDLSFRPTPAPQKQAPAHSTEVVVPQKRAIRGVPARRGPRSLRTVPQK